MVFKSIQFERVDSESIQTEQIDLLVSNRICSVFRWFCSIWNDSESMKILIKVLVTWHRPWHIGHNETSRRWGGTRQAPKEKKHKFTVTAVCRGSKSANGFQNSNMTQISNRFQYSWEITPFPWIYYYPCDNTDTLVTTPIIVLKYYFLYVHFHSWQQPL